jgi:hypothetical protein
MCRWACSNLTNTGIGNSLSGLRKIGLSFKGNVNEELIIEKISCKNLNILNFILDLAAKVPLEIEADIQRIWENPKEIMAMGKAVQNRVLSCFVQIPVK